ncbi:uncharacterized protein at4g26485 [Phtheirospermum japonicum]|uniref:Uncharacterized protein at4g26485 n=1 Tax=Phtheirospermum japonicum TaxID=374723 RepID=A0A830BYH1_9LAMI|nr:uncharacterized protein at4g26485 [Phtheirospermum japonicum]
MNSSTFLVREEKWINHYSSRHRILLVGEGDFSFALCLATAFGDASNIVATSLDSEEMLGLKYNGAAAANIALLKDKGCTILHVVDACSMSLHPQLKHRKFDRIVFNFPHAGFIAREHDSYQISLHQNVVRGFMRNGCNMATEKGEVHVTHKTAYPFSKWEIEELGQEAGLKLNGRADFWRWEYPGYVNRKGAGPRANETFPVGMCCTYKFVKSY